VQSETNIPAAPAGYATVNPFVITHDADGLIDLVKQVFRATVRPEARTLDDDGLLLHAELAIGNATVMFAERKPGWPFTPGLFQVYVDDVDATLKVARQLGATVVTEPTDFFGDTFSRFRDPWGNLWWVYRHGGQSRAGDEEGADWTGDAAATGAEEWDQSSPGLTYIHDTLLAAMRQLQDPREATP
jgi:PhnB protein